MDARDAPARRREQARERELRAKRTRLAAGGSLGAVVVITAVILFSSSGGGSSSHAQKTSAGAGSRSATASTTSSQAPAKPGTAAVPILTYHVINASPAQSGAAPELYVPAGEFSAQMDALKAAGWHAVTLDQLQASWTRGASLGPGKPIVIAFDGGYASQYSNALPVLKRLGWVGVEDLPATARSPSDGGMTDAQIRGLLSAGWELVAQGNSQTNLTILDSAQLSNEVTTARQTLHGRYGVPVNWFSYPSGAYNPTVTAAVRAAGYLGALTLVPGWASPQDDRFRLPRVQVVGGTAPAALPAQLASVQGDAPPPATSPGG
jgi:peptidoglycan/xylan/chitin deacetylase (PgdA/CDA1 family)